METKMNSVLQADPSRELEFRKKRLRDSCKEFESVMVSYMMKTMRNGNAWAEQHDSAREMYDDMLSEEVSKEISRSSVLGIGNMLYSKLEPLLKAEAKGESTGKNPAVQTPGPTVDTQHAKPGRAGKVSLNKLNNSAD